MHEASLDKLKSTLKQAGNGTTRSRAAVFSALQKGPSTIAGLISQLGAQADRATVYRTIELFEKLGITNRIWPGPEPLIELSEIFVPHHHHALCQNCHAAIDISSGELESALSVLAKKYSFLALSHSVELSGYCQRCNG